ncbi:aldo/keto reductase [Paenibacillus ottowii]|uniref:Aldo/keto reductase n=1 Tax=Paenibacillus ottowii TaxID=2315729 RepID=A0ABY3B724_9BACL|nr:aldo/keto reductase [Paenibacillus ottowii]NEU28041.1 aldo/keto reductase [Paenibacillus polymyxa]TQR99955.1 aldo/keto reductase [Paenibacillus ottowii]
MEAKTVTVADSTQLRKLGNSDLMLSPLGLGCWQFSNGKGMIGKFWPVMCREDIQQIIKTSLEGGINWFDTAEAYGGGQSEQLLADTLNEIGGPLAGQANIATKWWPAFRTADSITATIDVRIHHLAQRTIHLYQVHSPYSFASVGATMNAMAKLVKQGKIKYVGVSNFSAQQIREADRVLREHGLRLVSNQVKYSLLDRRIEQNGILDTAKELGVAIIAYSPLMQGILSGKFHKNPALVKSIKGPRKWTPAFRNSGLQRSKPLIEVLEQLAQQYNSTPTQIALNWLINAHGERVFAIPGASKVHHAQENVKAMKFTLTASEIEMVSHVSNQVLRSK